MPDQVRHDGNGHTTMRQKTGYAQENFDIAKKGKI
jgi:hypothetical protein